MTPAYKAEKKQLKEKLKEMNDDLEQSTPVFSPRFQVRIISGLYFGTEMFKLVSSCLTEYRIYLIAMLLMHSSLLWKTTQMNTVLNQYLNPNISMFSISSVARSLH